MFMIYLSDVESNQSINETAKQKPASNVPVDNVPGYTHKFLIQHLQKLLLTLIQLVWRHSKIINDG